MDDWCKVTLVIPLSAFWPPNAAKVRLASGHVHPVVGKGTVNV
jgi:hypothetical protein